ncbi:helicase [Nakamurella antarctica]|uniref:Helicase n=1 Tax=Nakamurella antarctica TaxID=1902245 RepID=A0A3G8ZIG2_9ACTN|nr:DEAD/DEAH box helicase [Nakamurella antarctica]AZI56968.1 helicase [Nakamurella antarctica]
MIDVLSLSRLVGGATLQKGLDYVRRGAVIDVAVTEEPLTVVGQVQGTARTPYRASVSLVMRGESIAALTGVCSCPVRMKCKHIAALIISGLGSRHAPPPKPAWERSLAGLIEQPDDEPATGEVPLGLQFELMAPASRYASTPLAGAQLRPSTLGIRPVQRGSKGKWVRTGIGWSNLHYFGYGRSQPNAAHLKWLSSIAAIAAGGSYYAPTSWLYLEDIAGAAFWDLLARAGEVGITLIGSDKEQSAVQVEARPVRIALDISRASNGISLRPIVAAAVGPVRSESCLLLGSPATAVVSWIAGDLAASIKDLYLTITPLESTVRKELRSVFQAGTQEIANPEIDRFVATYLPALRRRVHLTSTDESFTIPEPPLPKLELVVEHLPGHELHIRWNWNYFGDSTRQGLYPGAQRVTYRDLEFESAVLQRLSSSVLALPALFDAGRITPEKKLAGLQMLEFLAELLPVLQNLDGLELVVLGEATYRAAESDAVIAIAGSESAQGRDWLDLEISVSVDGADVPLREIFLALARGQDHMIMEDGTYFRLATTAFEQLRVLIEEARLLLDPGEKSVRISRYQASLWNDLHALGVVDDQARAWQESVSALNNVGELTHQELAPTMDVTLRPYQQDGYDWLSFLCDSGLGGILADDMGLGKTIQALALITRAVHQGRTRRPFLVVAPTSVVGNWQAETKRFAPTLSTVAVTGTGKKRGIELADVVEGADIVITSYALFRLEFAAYDSLEWAGLILDEAQFVKNHLSQGYKCAKKLTTPFKLAITGTPMENNLMELWSLFSITAPGLFATPQRFAEYYQKPIEKGVEAEKLAQLRRRIRPLMLRRTKDQVAKDLPPKQEQTIELELNPQHRKVYQTHLQRERQKVLGLINDMDKNRFEIFRSLTLLRRLSLDASLIDEKYSAIPSTKLDALLEQLDDIVAEGHRVLVFSQFTGFLTKVRGRLESAGFDYCYLDGSTRDRPEVLDRFKSGRAPVFLISLKAGGFGLNLTEADYCILLDPWWNPASEAQAVDRVHRIGQTKNVMVYRLVAKGTIEEKVMALKASKAKLFSSVMDSGGVPAGALTASDIRGLLS